MRRAFPLLLSSAVFLACGCVEIRLPSDDPRPADDRVPSPAPDRDAVRNLVPTLRQELGNDSRAAAFYAAYYDLLLQNVDKGRYDTLDSLGKVTLEVPGIAGYPSVRKTADAADNDLTAPAGNASLAAGSDGHTYITTVLSRLRDACKEVAR